MDFKEFVISLPNQRSETIAALARVCRVSPSTVYRWLNGDFFPDPLKRKVIADYLDIPEKVLWPNL